PVVSPEGEYLGVFSERCSMQVLLDAAYEQLPSNRVSCFMDQEAATIREDTQLLSIAQAFLLTAARRLPVLDGDRRLVGQVSRRDVLRAALDSLKAEPSAKESSLLYLSALFAREDAPVA
ncbi:MAG: CBS domain-containing protein, partial [Planctomycetota bacterium]